MNSKSVYLQQVYGRKFGWGGGNERISITETAPCFLPKLEPRVGRASCRMADGLLEAVRGLWLADPELDPR